MNKFCVVTGGTKGIGRAILTQFAQEGFDVATCSRSEADLKSLKQYFEQFSAINVHTVKADLSSRKEVDVFIQSILSLNRNVDVLVNNAGYFTPGEITTEPEGTLEALMNSNLYSAYHVTRGLVDSMKKRREGHIFNICSIASIMAYSNGGSYAISKFAQLGFSKCLREELKKHGIRVTSVLPGATKTASWEGVDIPEERFMKVDDVANSVFSAYSISGRSVVEEIVIRPLLGDL